MVYVASRAGIHHEICEDAALVGTEILSDTSKTLAMPEEGFICLADGVGGNSGGALASRRVLAALASVAENSETLRESLIEINRDFIVQAKETPEASAMATTLTGVHLRDGAYQLLHIGNTRAYIRQGNYLKQITPDHTTYQWFRSCGQFEAAETCNKSEITSCFGGANPALLTKLIVSDLPPFSLMVLTSDGVHEFVDLDTLEGIFTGEGTWADKCEAILNEARSNGSEDDMTILLVIPER